MRLRRGQRPHQRSWARSLPIEHIVTVDPLGAAGGTWTPKDEAACCLSRRDACGRLPVGFCGPDCIRRAERDERLRNGLAG